MASANIDTIIRKYSPLVRSICYRMTWNNETSEDAYQETWIEVMKSIDSFNHESQLSTWIYKIAFRTILRYVKREKSYSMRFIGDFIESQTDGYNLASEIDHDNWIRTSCNRCLTGFLYCLSKEDRILYILKDIGELDYKIISEIIEDTPVNLRQRMLRIRRRLNNFIKGECLLSNPKANCKCKLKNHVKEIKLDEEFEKIRLEMKSMNIFQIADSIFPTIEVLKERCSKMSHCSPMNHKCSHV